LNHQSKKVVTPESNSDSNKEYLSMGNTNLKIFVDQETDFHPVNEKVYTWH
jgi:hypothetical protein